MERLSGSSARPSDQHDESRHRDVIETDEKAARRSLKRQQKLGKPQKKRFFADAGVATCYGCACGSYRRWAGLVEA